MGLIPPLLNLMNHFIPCLQTEGQESKAQIYLPAPSVWSEVTH